MSIEKRSPGYALLKSYVDFCFHRYYRVSFHQKERINLRERMIFAPNHQNALIDALAVLTSFKWQPVFLARADIFGNKTIARILRFLKILPVYRIRDGYDQLANNEKVFRETFDVLDKNTSLTILPEGNHEGKRQLRTLKKGIARIAFNYRHEFADNKKEISIIPTGLNYSDYHAPGSNLHIRFGDPIPLADFDQLYQENQPKAYNGLIKRLESELKKQMLHIEDGEYYRCTETIVLLYETLNAKNKGTENDIFLAQQQVIDLMGEKEQNDPEFLIDLQGLTQSLEKILSQVKTGIDDLKLLKKAKNTFSLFFRMMFLFLTSPLYLYCFIQNAIPSWIRHTIGKKFKDPHFKSSVAFVLTIFLFPIFHILQALIFLLISGSLTWSAVYLVTLPLSYIGKNMWERMWKQTQAIGRMRSVYQPIGDIIGKIKKELTLTGINWQ